MNDAFAMHTISTFKTLGSDIRVAYANEEPVHHGQTPTKSEKVGSSTVFRQLPYMTESYGMRLKFIIFILLLSATTTSGQELINFDTLRVSYLTGDEVMYTKSLIVYKAKDRLKAVNQFEYFIGVEPLKSDTFDLDKRQQDLIQGFLETAIHFKDTCTNQYVSTSSEDYIIEYTNTVISITGRFCNWGDYSYDQLEEDLFSEYFDQLSSKRRKYENYLDSSIAGNWQIVAPDPPWKWGTKVELVKQTELTNKVGWVFNSRKKFSVHTADPLKLEKLESYEWDIDEGSVLLTIDSEVYYIAHKGSKLYKGATFRLKKLTPDKVELEFLWR